MTIRVKIENMESSDDQTKELVIQTLREDDSVQSTQALKGGCSTEIAVYSHNHFKILERFTDNVEPK